MTTEWFFGSDTGHPAGRHGVIAILADVSGSMPIHTLTPALRDVAAAVPSARVFVFACRVAEAIRLREGGGLPDVGGDTRMDLGLELVAGLRPQDTIVLSDGGVGVRRERSFEVAGGMTGAISTVWIATPGCSYYYVGNKENCDRRFMEELARRNRGQFSEYSYGDGPDVLVRELLTIIRIRTAHLHHRVEVHHHYGLPPEHIDHGRQGMAFSSTTARVRRRQP